MLFKAQLLTIALFISSSPLLAAKNYETAILAGGCFWCIEADYEKLDGIKEVVSGYTGGKLKDPTYKQVSSGRTQHIESVKITYDPDKISYTEILDYFWRHIDPTRDDGQFCDRGNQYRPAIFYLNAAQKKLAYQSEKNINRIKPFEADLKVLIQPASTFYLAEEYHQDYYKKNPLRYRYYRFSCRRDARVEELWGK